MIKAHVTSVRVHGAGEADGVTAVDADATGKTVTIPTSTATPVDTAIRVTTAQAPLLPYPIVVPLLRGATCRLGASPRAKLSKLCASQRTPSLSRRLRNWYMR